MLINISRIKTAMTCWRKAYWLHAANLSPASHHKSPALLMGTAFHEGMASGRATGDWDQAKNHAEEVFNAEAGDVWLDLEEDEKERARTVVLTLVKLAGEDFSEKAVSVLQPECEFRVPIPGTEHHDITLHWLRHNRTTGRSEVMWGYPPSQDIIEGNVMPIHGRDDPACPCYRPHYLVGKVDSLVNSMGSTWIEEHKTTSRFGELFWRQWANDLQPIAYTWAMEQVTGMEIEGFILNGARKPANRTTLANIPKYCEYESRPYPLTTEQKIQTISNITNFMFEWERRILDHDWPLSNTTSICTTWNRACSFFDICTNEMSHEQILSPREPDYVLDHYARDTKEALEWIPQIDHAP